MRIQGKMCLVRTSYGFLLKDSRNHLNTREPSTPPLATGLCCSVLPPAPSVQFNFTANRRFKINDELKKNPRQLSNCLAALFDRPRRYLGERVSRIHSQLLSDPWGDICVYSVQTRVQTMGYRLSQVLYRWPRLCLWCVRKCKRIDTKT